MAVFDKDRLLKAIKEAVAKITKYRTQGLGEQDTKASLIEPLFESLGWDMRDPEQVTREFRTDGKDNPVDYALKLIRQPKLLVEAKGLGESLSDRRWVGQILGYAAVAGAKWCVLTDGDSYAVYNATAPVDASDKLLCQAQLSTDPIEDVAQVLGLMSRANMEDNLLATLWDMQFVDKKVRAVLQGMFQTPDKGLIRLIRTREQSLTPKQIAESIRRQAVRIDPPPLWFKSTRPTRSSSAAVASSSNTGKGLSKKKRSSKPTRSPVQHGVELTDLIAAGLLACPLRLFRKYRGKVLEATLSTDGQVTVDGTIYPSASTAASTARASITGRPMSTNGWAFWQVQDGNKVRTLEEVRTAYLMRRKPS